MSPGGSVIDEAVIADLWERQAFDSAGLSAGGFRVIFRGLPSDAGGPDYQDAVLSRNDRDLVRGDVEFHVRSSDWYHHGHHRDHRYDDVILHVVWTNDTPQTLSAVGTPIPVLALEAASPMMPSAPIAGPVDLCVSRLAGFTAEELRRLVIRAGWDRFRDRTDRFAADCQEREPDQVLYELVMEGFGYASNRGAFRALADAVPFSWLMSVKGNRLDVLLDAAGLGPPSPVAPPAHLPSNSWRLARIRPGNHPALRLAGLCVLLNQWGSSPAEHLTGRVRQATKPADLRRSLLARNGERTFVGRGRADELAVSAILPFVGGLGESRAEELFDEYPSPPRNRWTRLMMDRFQRAGHLVPAKRAVEHQGMHALYHDHCRPQKRNGCPICSA